MLIQNVNMNLKAGFVYLTLIVSAVCCAKSISLNLGYTGNLGQNVEQNLGQNLGQKSFGNVEVKASALNSQLVVGVNSISGQIIDQPEASKKVVETEVKNNNSFLSSKSEQNSLPENVELVQVASVETLSPKPPEISAKPPANLSLSNLQIPSINLNTAVDFASVTNLPVLEEKLLYKPLIEDVLSKDFCKIGGHSYVYGHSEPAVNGTENYPATYIFSNLEKLSVGQQIDTTNLSNLNCSYMISEIFVVTTNSKDAVSDADYAKLFYPLLIADKSILTLQTCVKGSATQRLIIRAVSV